MAGPSSPTVRRRRLAAELRRLREHAGLNGDQVAERLGWSASKISRIELGRTGVSQSDVRKLVGLYGVEDSHAAKLISLAREAARKGWWEAYSDALPDAWSAYIGLEAEAAASYQWHVQVVPGLLQTADYARAIIQAWQSIVPIAPGEIERRVEARLECQRVLTREPPLTFKAILDESVLLRRFGDASVMRSQLQRLIERADLPTVTLQVLPLDRPHPVPTESFVLMEFPPVHGTAFHDVVYIENLDSHTYIEEETDTYRYRLVFEQLAEQALEPKESLDLISKTARRVWG